MSQLRAEHLFKQFKSRVVVNDVSIDVNTGEIVGLLGPNGAGKTTLLRIIAGIMKPTKGEIVFNDKKLADNEIEIKKNISFLSGNTKLYKDISCVELLKMCAEYYEMDKKKRNKMVALGYSNNFISNCCTNIISN